MFLPIVQYFDHTHIATLIEERLTCDHIMQTLIQGKRLFVVLSDIECDLWVVMLARLLLRRLQQARAYPLATPILEHGQSINIPFVILCLMFEPPSNGCVESFLIATPKAQH